MYRSSFRTGRICCLTLLKEVDRKVKQKKYKGQVFSHSTSNEADFSVFNLRTAQYMKYISQKRERNGFVSGLSLCGIKSTCLPGLRSCISPKWVSSCRSSLLSKCTPLSCCENDYGTTDGRLYNLRSGITSRRRWIPSEQQSHFVQIWIREKTEGRRNTGNLWSQRNWF